MSKRQRNKGATFITTYFSSLILSLALMVPNGTLGTLPPTLTPGVSAPLQTTEEPAQELPLSITDYAEEAAEKQEI
ncbi:MAG: hypothetical protein HYT41_00915, partial [Candidatus Sungbacteria bacterium]|nr:hypothetical protein [Candidatus Sungbacteria bacterium]